MKYNKNQASSLAAAFIAFGSLTTGANAENLKSEAIDQPAPESTKFNEGDWLLGFSGSYNYLEDSEDSVNLFYVDVDFSYFINNRWSLGMSTFGLLLPEGGSVEETGYAIGLEPNLRYYFQNESQYIPYLGIHTGYAYASIDDDSESLFTYGLHAGVLFPLTESAYFDAKLKWTEYEISDASDIDLTALQLLVGFKIKF